MLHRRVLGAGVVLGDPDERRGQHEADGAGAEQTHLAAGGRDGVVRHQPGGHAVEGHQGQHPGHCQALVQGGHDVLHAGRGLHKEAADDRSDDGHGAQCQWVEHGIEGAVRHHQGTEPHGGDQGDRIGFEQVGRHAGTVAHVVAHVVGDHRGVARVIFRDAGLHLAHQIGPHVGAFGEDAAAKPCKDRDQGRAKSKADQGVQLLGQRGVR